MLVTLQGVIGTRTWPRALAQHVDHEPMPYLSDLPVAQAFLAGHPGKPEAGRSANQGVDVPRAQLEVPERGRRALASLAARFNIRFCTAEKGRSYN